MATRGLGNVGNTCGLNALIQCIAHTDALREFFLESAPDGTIAEGHTYSIVNELKRLLQEFWVSDRSLVPKRFAKAFEEATKGRIAMGEQMDMSEVFMVLQDKFEREWASTGTAVTVTVTPPWPGDGAAQGTPAGNLNAHAMESWARFMGKVPQRWAHITSGLQLGQVVCGTCKHVYHNFEPFSSLSLEIPKPAAPGASVHLSECFKAFFDAEALGGGGGGGGGGNGDGAGGGGGWKCDKCSGHNAEKLVRFWAAPKVLVVVLKRFRFKANGQMEKKHVPIDIPETFEFLPATELAPGKDRPLYRIRAIGTHFGSLNSGHYTALAAHSGKWYHFDDLNINPLANADMALKNNIHAYMLFYERSS